jgi:hypothetical protein
MSHFEIVYFIYLVTYYFISITLKLLLKFKTKTSDQIRRSRKIKIIFA